MVEVDIQARHPYGRPARVQVHIIAATWTCTSGFFSFSGLRQYKKIGVSRIGVLNSIAWEETDGRLG